jgi:hypothetical protein
MWDIAQLKKHQLALKKRLQHLHETQDDTVPEDMATIQEQPHIDQTELASTNSSSLIFERSVMQPLTRTQSLCSCKSIPHLTQEAYVPSVLDAAAQTDGGDSYELICGSSGHPLCKRRHSMTSMCPLSHDHLAVVISDDEEEHDQQDVDYSDHTKLNFCSFSDMIDDEESEKDTHVSPTLTRRSSVVVVPLSRRATAAESRP